MSMTYARILEFGAPKVGKTKNLCETCPGPVLLMNFDSMGWASITARQTRVLTSLQLRAALAGHETLHPDEVIVVDYSAQPKEITLSEKSLMSIDAVSNFIMDFNAVFKNCPFGTVVVDPITMWDTSVNSFIGGKASVDVLQIQHWGQAAKKKEEIINCVNSLPCNTAFIAHEEYVSDKLSGQVMIMPLCTGKLQPMLAMLFSQVVYAEAVNDGRGKMSYQLRTQPFGLVKGVGLRWPQDRPATVPNSWKGIFGE